MNAQEIKLLARRMGDFRATNGAFSLDDAKRFFEYWTTEQIEQAYKYLTKGIYGKINYKKSRKKHSKLRRENELSD